MEMIKKVQVKVAGFKERAAIVLKNKRGDISETGKNVIKLVAILALLAVTVTVITWMTNRVDDTINTIDTEYNQWNN